jgi:hypothetical protein
MMSGLIKRISSFSSDAVDLAITQAVGDDKQKLVDLLKKVEDVLGAPPNKKRKGLQVHRLPDEEVFERGILPQIKDKLAEYDQLETSAKELQWKAQFEFLENMGDFRALTMDELKKRHTMIVEEEKSLACLDLVVKYYRGLVYFRARELIHGAYNIKTAFRTEFGVCYNTAMRYITFAALIKRYPRLMICGLTYPQIIKHQNRLLNHLKTNTTLHDMLSQPLELVAQDKVVEISPSDIDVPKSCKQH